MSVITQVITQVWSLSVITTLGCAMATVHLPKHTYTVAVIVHFYDNK
jgi:hypothetical protein